ncbi:MAG: acylneuraminate cytidylyltransferase family protein, partial [Bacteroidota bacterium]|nr:acylneuraminate cytidylyltransferase family protein [Bacteroidota bacterium]
MLLITLCARGGSKGIPGKNILPINGKPLIAYSIDTAMRFSQKVDARIAISTDDEVIRQTAARFGLTTDYQRPAVFATDSAGKTEAILDLLRFEEVKTGSRFEYILDLDVTSPLRTVEDLEQAFDMIQQDPDALNLFSVNKAHRNPYFNMVEPSGDGYYQLVKKGEFLTRQSAPPVYDLNASFYFYRRSFFDREKLTTINSRSMVYVMPHICFDLD